MINIQNGELTVIGQGDEIACEIGTIVKYFVQNCTRWELDAMLHELFDELAQEDKIKFFRGLQKAV